MPTIVITNNTAGGDFSGTEDCTIRDNSLTTNVNGSDLTVRDSAAKQKLLIRFTGLSNIIGPVTVSSATLQLYLKSSSAASGRSIVVRKCLRPWTETGVTYNTYDGTNAWTTAGAEGSGSDIGSADSGDVNQPETPTLEYRSFSTAGMAADVQDWINNGSNNGWLLFATDTFADWVFARREAAEDANRPKLTVVYTTSGDNSYPVESTIYV